MSDEKDMEQSDSQGLPENGVETPAEESQDALRDPDQPEVEASAEAGADEPPDADVPQNAEDASGDEPAENEASAEQADEIDGSPNLAPSLKAELGLGDDGSADEVGADVLEMLEGLPEQGDKPSADDIDFGSTSVSKAEFQHLQEPVTPPDARNIELLMDVDLPISIELGRTKMSISDILALGPGSVVELNKLAGEPVDLLVNYKVVARGEVVVVDENFGLRITQLMTPEERLKALAEE